MFFVVLSGAASAFDISGLQPVAPNGVFSTFSAESMPKNQGAVEIGVERSRDPSFYRFRLSGAYGISDALEFNITAPYVYNFGGATDGMEDIALGFKHRFYEEGKYGPSLAYMLTVSVNNGREEFSSSGRFGAGLILSKRVGPFKGHMNLFYERPGTGRLGSEVSALGGIEFSAAHSFKLLAEVIVQRSHASNHYDRVETRFGYRIKATDYLYTTLGVGLDLKKREPEYRVLLSVSFVSSPEKKPIRKIFEEE